MPSESTALFLSSLTRCLAVPAFLEGFYDRFVGSSEEVREKFRDVDLKRQVRMLQDSLYVVAVAAQGEEGSPARNALPWLAERHSRRDLDIRPECTTCGLTVSSRPRVLTTRSSVRKSRAHGARPSRSVPNYMRERSLKNASLRMSTLSDFPVLCSKSGWWSSPAALSLIIRKR